MELTKVISFAEFLVKELALNKDAIEANLKEDDTAYVISIAVDDSDIGRVIGKQGKTANALRTVIKSFAGRLNKHLVIKFNQ